MWFHRIKRFYESGLWTKEQVQDAVNANKITSIEYENIVGEQLETP